MRKKGKISINEIHLSFDVNLKNSRTKTPPITDRSPHNVKSPEQEYNYNIHYIMYYKQ